MDIEVVRALIRPFIAVSVVGTLMGLFIVSRLEAKELLILAGPIIGFYFGERAAEKRQAQ